MDESINIPFMVHKRLQHEAIKNFGANWSTTHDKWVTRQLFKQGIITDHQRSVQLEKIDHRLRSIRRRDPDAGRFRLW